MDGTTQRAFLLLIVAQALHSIEEYAFSLWEVLAPARFLSSLVSGSDLGVGFAVINVGILTLALLTWAVPVRRGGAWALPLAWFWTLLEAANGIGHLSFAIMAGGYFPGAYTAPLLLACSAYLAARLIRRSQVA